MDYLFMMRAYKWAEENICLSSRLCEFYLGESFKRRKNSAFLLLFLILDLFILLFFIYIHKEGRGGSEEENTYEQ